MQKENKERIVRSLLPVLQQTRHFEDLMELEYYRSGATTEVVVGTFVNGYKKTANVSMDSGKSMIVDIIQQLS